MTKAEKAEYDRLYRAKNKERLRAQRAAYFQRTYDPEKAAIERKKKMPRHLEYCRQPKYKTYKAKYDGSRRAAMYGEYAEAYELLKILQKEVRRKQPDRFERYKESGRKQWSYQTQQRRRRREEEL